MLYKYLLDDVARKQPKKAEKQQLVESSTGEYSPKKAANMLRTRSAKQPKRKLAPGFPMKKFKGHEMDDDESLPSSPQVPAFAATKTTKDEVRRGENRLTM